MGQLLWAEMIAEEVSQKQEYDNWVEIIKSGGREAKDVSCLWRVEKLKRSILGDCVRAYLQYEDRHVREFI